LKNMIRAFALGAVGVVVLASALVHPSGPVKAVRSDNPLLAGAEVDPDVFEVLQRSCQNCHSDKTEWPWYSHIAPMSWLVEGDVSQARSHMNLSHWGEYTVEEQQDLLARIGSAVRSGEMPPARYTMIHGNSKLSPAERDNVYRWAHAERRRLKSAPSTSMGTGF
jgi:Haem-binding domain